MAVNLRHRSFVTERDLTAEELRYLIALSAELKAAARAGTEQRLLTGKRIALIWARTPAPAWCALDAAACGQGARVTYLGPESSLIGHGVPVRDTARALGRMYDAIDCRDFGQEIASQFAAYAGVPVYSGLSGEAHPVQALADMLTMQEHSGKPLRKIAYCFVGDARFSAGTSLMIMGCQLGMDVRICGPYSLWPDAARAETAHRLAKESGGQLLVTDDVEAAVSDVDYICTDGSASMGEDEPFPRDRANLLRPYRVNIDMIERAWNPRVKLMYRFPASRGCPATAGREIRAELGPGTPEVTGEVFESGHSIVFDEAENRMHAIKAVLVATLAG